MSTNNSYVNKYFDQVYVLNLDTRPDRKVAMLQKLSRLGITAEFVRAINGYSSQNHAEHLHYLEQPIGESGAHKLEIEYNRKLIKSPGAWGYLKTFLGILNDAKKRGFERILCFDDDVLFHREFEQKFTLGIKNIPEDWKLLYLGASQYVWKIPQGLRYNTDISDVDNSVSYYYPNNTDGSFAIGIHVSVFDLLIREVLKMNCPFDSGPLRNVIDTYPDLCFVLNPNIVIADVTESNIREDQDQQAVAEDMRWNLDEYNFPFTQDLVSVIIPAYNAEATIEKSIRSILLQSYPELEVIIVDDGSSDGTAGVVKRIEAEDSRVMLVSLDTNQGVGNARNKGIEASNGVHIAFQDADDISLRDRLTYQLIPIYEKNVLFSIARFYRSRCTYAELNLDNQEATLALVERRRVTTASGFYEYRDRAEVGMVTMVCQRTLFETFGLYGNHRFGEDLELVERILYYQLNKTFHSKYNGHTYLTDHKSVPSVFYRLDKLLYLSPEMNENNLTVQYEKRENENLIAQQKMRDSYKSTGLEQYLKIPKLQFDSPPLMHGFNTLIFDSFVLVPEHEHDLLINHLDEVKELRKQNIPIDEVYNSLSWKVTRPLRWMGAYINKILKRIK